MKRFVVALTALASLAVPAPADAGGTLDQSQTALTCCQYVYGSAYLAQSFTAGLSGQLDQVDVFLTHPYYGTPGPLTLEIRTLSGGVPSATVLASEEVSSVPDGWLSVTLNPTLSVSAGAQYAIVLSAPSGDPYGGFYSWYGNGSNPYGGGQWLRTFDSGASWQALSDADAGFKTYVSTNLPPSCSDVSASPNTLEQHRDHFVLITLSGGSDPDGDPLTFTVDGVTQDERVTTRGDDTSPDAQPATNSNQVQLRAERNSRGDGRVYRIAYTLSDGQGDSCGGTAYVAVPRKRGVTAVDSGGSYDSFGS
jgi:hypothetical protein